jgi:23S rRNA pseudouridine2605 synthase
LTQDRLQKILSQRNFGSRRDCEKIIINQRVLVNGQIVNLGDKADPEVDRILVDGIPITKERIKKIYIAFNKPVNVISEIKKTDKRKIVSDFVPREEHLYIVGRLDYRSEGLIFMTNDGEMANRLTHPRYEHEKEYRVLINRSIQRNQINLWAKGIELPSGYHTLPAKVKVLESSASQTWLRIIMLEGKKRQIREVGKVLGIPVSRIIRDRIGTLKIGNLISGEWRYLSDEEIKDLKKYSGLI